MARRRSGGSASAPVVTVWPVPARVPPLPLEGSPVERLRPRTAPQILDAGFEVMRFRGKTIAILLAVFHGPLYLAAYIMLRQADNGSVLDMLLDRFWPGDEAFRPMSTAEWWGCGALAATLLGEMLFAVALATLMRSWLDGLDPGPVDVVRTVARRLPAVVVVWTMAAVLKALSIAFCLVGIIAVLPQLSILGAIVGFESAGPFAWIARSRELTSRATQRALYLTAMAPVLTLLVLGSLRLGDGLGINRIEAFSTVMATVVTLALLVARCSATTLFYLDIRVRTEGLDLAIRAPHALGQQP